MTDQEEPCAAMGNSGGQPVVVNRSYLTQCSVVDLLAAKKLIEGETERRRKVTPVDEKQTMLIRLTTKATSARLCGVD